MTQTSFQCMMNLDVPQGGGPRDPLEDSIDDVICKGVRVGEQCNSDKDRCRREYLFDDWYSATPASVLGTILSTEHKLVLNATGALCEEVEQLQPCQDSISWQ